MFNMVEQESPHQTKAQVAQEQVEVGKKRALLVGIKGPQVAQHRGGRCELPELKGPHTDVAVMRKLLIEQYEYRPQDIVVLVDGDTPGQVQPTRSNMEVRNLVKDAKRGDKLLFHWHSTQIENKNNSEEDGMDECIIPSDGPTKLITDNELRRCLVDPLPVGCSLTAILDACHSASLLDLTHSRCNRIYVPWLSTGKQRSHPFWNVHVRRRALASSRHINIPSRNSSIDHFLVHSERKSRRTAQTKTSLSTCIKSEGEWYDTPSSPIQRSTSPDPLFPCTGFCDDHTDTSPDKEAYVISLASCRDDQLTWEDADGKSMTQILAKILEKDPHPNLHELMTRVSHEIHKTCLKVHEAGRKYKRRLKKKNERLIALGKPPIPSDQADLATDKFQDAQLASHRPLNMNALWSP
ncbi:caspase domain-containing protein [Infundibulicybe gibba]|nr:caspase domain-containing protein [Infundibulicybe gibba]